MNHSEHQINIGINPNDAYHHPPHHAYGTVPGYPVINEASAPPLPHPPQPPQAGVPPPPQAGAPPPPPMYVGNTNTNVIYVNTGEPIGYAVVDSGPPGLPCCGIGLGWFLFILGWFFGGIPWYVGAIILVCSKVDPEEKPGYFGCTIFAVVITIVAIIMAVKGK